MNIAFAELWQSQAGLVKDWIIGSCQKCMMPGLDEHILGDEQLARHYLRAIIGTVWIVVDTLSDVLEW